jgi:spermidine synthase
MSTTAVTVNQSTSYASRAALALLCGCFVVSGFAALVYQTAWTRQFAIIFGTSELAIATVLAAYMGGLALGAWLAERFLPRVDRPVMTYALLELGIAASALFAVPALLWLANLGLQGLFGGQPEPPDSDHAGTTFFYLVSAFIALALPTTLMGATLPLLARYVVGAERQIGPRIGVLYAMNTFGAVGGALVTAFVLLPDFGLSHTIWFGAACNVLVFLLAVMLARRIPYSAPRRGYELDAPIVRVALPRPERPHSFNRLPGPAWVLPLMLLAGAAAFFQEVLWSRMFSHILGSSIYAFGVMVASFLAGIALGGGLGAAIARTRQWASAALAVVLILAGVFSAIAYRWLGNLVPAEAGLMRNMVHVAGFELPMNALLAGLLLLPMTLAIGTTYPLAVRVLANGPADAAPASARVYAWNTVGAIVGSLAAGFYLIPLLRYEGAIRVAVWTSIFLGVVAVWMLARQPRIFAGIVTLFGISSAGFALVQAPMTLLKTSPLNVGTDGRVLSYDIGRSASVVMLAKDGGLELRTNGLPEAIMDGRGSLPRFSGEYWLSPIAVVARPAAKDMLIVGFGGGVVVEAVPPSISHVDVIELEPKVIAANKSVAAMRRRDPLADPRVNVILNDARGALRLTSRRYDAIVSQPSHPWTAGASHLYTREFMALAKEHLNPDGVFVQWMNVIFMDEALLRSLTATLLDVYREVRVYRPDPNTVLFVASDAPLDPESRLLATGQPLRDAPLHYARYGINNAEDLVAALFLDTAGARRFSADSPLITDDDNRIATSSVFERQRGMSGDSSGRLLAAEDPLQRRDSFVYTGLRDQLSFPYIARRNGVFVLLDPSLNDRNQRMAGILEPSAAGEYARAFYYRMRREPLRADEQLKLAIAEYPGDPALRAEFLRGRLGSLIRDQAAPDVAEIAAGADATSQFMIATLRHALKGEWREIAQADAQLAEIAWSDPWYPEAAEMRINWRTRVMNPQAMKQYGEEAIAMIDRSCLLSPTLALYGFRARAGFNAGQPEVVVESVSAYAKLAGRMVRFHLNPVESLRQDQKALTTILDDAMKMTGADAARVAEVRAEVAALAQIR